MPYSLFIARKPVRQRCGNQSGYIMLSLILIVTLMIIAATAVLPAISYQIRRDREIEMIHRGVQYSRAIRGYYKKFGRYPTKLEDLDNTNNLRYLRKHYKDPMTGKDFRLLHYGEQGVTLAGGIGGLGVPGTNPIGSPGGLNGVGQNGGFGNGAAGSSFNGPGSNSGFGNTGVNNNGIFSQNSSVGANSNSDPGGNSNAQGTPQGSASPGSDPTSASQQVTGSGPGTAPTASSQQLLPSGPIVGVASMSKDSGYHEYNHKKKYNEWQFIYDPGTDRGGLIQTPNQPTLAGFGSSQGGFGTQPGIPAATPLGQSPFGQTPGQSPFGQNSFGQPSGGFNNNQNPAQPPSSNPPQQ